MEGIKNFLRNASTGLKVAVGGFLALVLVIIVVAIVVLVTPGPVEDTHVEVANFEEATEVPDDYQTNIQKLMWGAIESNDALNNVVFTDAEVRKGSYSETTSGGATIAKFIIDVPSMRYSFAVTASWADGNVDTEDKSIYLECPHYLDVIYTDTKCIAATPIEQVERYLPHYDYVSDGKLVSVMKRKYDVFQEHAGEPYLAISVNACGDAGVMEAARNVVVQWLKSIYLDPNDYYLEVLDTCQ